MERWRNRDSHRDPFPPAFDGIGKAMTVASAASLAATFVVGWKALIVGIVLGICAFGRTLLRDLDNKP